MGTRSRLLVAAVAALGLAPVAGRATILEPTPIFVSTTLNDTIQVFDPISLQALQPPIASRGGGPVRMWAGRIEGRPTLLTANHGAPLGSIGAFVQSNGLWIEAAGSPSPARAGAVAIDAAIVSLGGDEVPMAFTTNTWHALGGCGMPAGSVTAHRLVTGTGPAVAMVEVGTVDLTGSIPYGVAVDPRSARAYASTNCAGTLETIEVSAGGNPYLPRPTVERTDARSIHPDAAPDAVVFDPASELIFVANINDSSVSVFDARSPTAVTTVPLPGARPIDATLAVRGDGRRWVITSNGGDDSVSIVDIAAVQACRDAATSACDAEIARIGTAVPGGAPEGVAFHAASDRVFVVNKPVMDPSLSVIQLSVDGPSVTGSDIARIPLGALDPSVPIPAVIAFDVVVGA